MVKVAIGGGEDAAGEAVEWVGRIGREGSGMRGTPLRMVVVLLGSTNCEQRSSEYLWVEKTVSLECL
jgi:hypothetical protein